MNHKTKEELIAFETKIKAAFEAGELPYLIHLSGGNEQALIDIFEVVRPGDWVFATHRNHYHYLLAGGDEDRLERLIRAGRSMFVYERALNFFTSSIVAGTPCIAAGVALSLRRRGSDRRVFCFVGDASEDQGHFYEAVRWVASNNLPCVFIVENNNRSVESSIQQRHGPNPWHACWPPCVKTYHYAPTYPHAGTGCKQWVKFKDLTPPLWP
jgi:pyruvate dehydrogenase E1 component alpha subunit